MDIKEVIGLFPVVYSNIGNGSILGLIATIHMLASHVSVGAALISTWLATIAVRRNRPELLKYVRRYGVFLLVFSYVIGSITGVGIWFSATIASPRGLSFLIHNFVWLWGIEWLFFVIEVVGIYMLVYLEGRIDQQSYLKVAWIFGLTSWATLLVIAGILSFMMFPGQESWYSEGGSLKAIFGAYTFAQIFSRTCFMLVAAALAGGIIAATIEDVEFKTEITTTLSKLGIVTAILGFVFFKLSLGTMPENAQLLLKNHLPGYFEPFLWLILISTIGYFVALWLRPYLLTTQTATVMLVLLMILGIYPAEKAREIARKPYVAAYCVYPNGIVACDIPWLGIKSELTAIKGGVLKTLPFIPERLRKITPDNQKEAGKALALNFCSSCHGLGNSGPRSFSDMFANKTNVAAIETFIKGSLVTGNMKIMPKMPFSNEEVHALAVFIANSKH